VEEVFDGELEPALRHRDVDRQAQVLDAYFRERAQVTPAMEEFYALKARIENGASRMDDLPVPGRRLHRLFKAHLGFAPKTFARVVRFQRALARLRIDPGCTLAQVAVECGYSDQPHFVREHRLFAGVPPREQVGYYPADAPTDFSPNLVRFVQETQRQ
jgi:transcriptional regulator GlxA family with amidase domain